MVIALVNYVQRENNVLVVFLIFEHMSHGQIARERERSKQASLRSIFKTYPHQEDASLNEECFPSGCYTPSKSYHPSAVSHQTRYIVLLEGYLSFLQL
jgi:hypothetical protein